MGNLSNQVSFKRVVNGTPEFDHIKQHFNNLISELYGNQENAIQKIADGKDRNCELLIGKNSEEYGILVYKSHIISQIKDLFFHDTFVIKSLFVINPLENSGKRVATRLLNRCCQIACRLNAKHIFVSVSSKRPESIAFFLSYGFRIESVYQDLYAKGLNEYFLFYHEPEKLLSNTFKELSLQGKQQASLSLCKNDFGEGVLTTMEAIVVGALADKKNPRDFFYVYYGFSTIEELIQSSIKKFARLTLGWQERKTAKRYLVIFLSPLYQTPDRNQLLGDLMIGITIDGERHVLAFCPSRLFPAVYWSQFFSELKATGIEKIDILCCPEPQNVSVAINESFPHTKIEKATCPKSWFSANFYSKSLFDEMISKVTYALQVFDRAKKDQISFIP
jgi:hypothetical protein